ncbi:MAG TPA: hypothetical protein VF323_09665 [Candidatus Limnocylindrales bacterium]
MHEYQSLDSPTLVAVPRFRPVADLSRPRLTVLMPHLQLTRMTGGPNTILNVTGRLAEHGIALRYVATFGRLDGDAGPLRDHIAALSGSAVAGRESELVAADAPIAVAPNEVFMATWWPTAYVALEALATTRVREFLYFIQDFEPGFYPWSTNHALALATYDFPCRAVFNERLLRTHFASAGIGRFGAGAADDAAVAFDPAVDRELFRRPPADDGSGPGRPRRLLFYARPRNDRNCFALGLRALRIAAQNGVFDREPWEFVAIGADVPELALSSRHVLRPAAWLDYREYAKLLGGSDLLLSLMLSPHTSYPPIEMAAAGNLAITNTFGAKTGAALGAISPRIIGVPPTVDGLVEGLRDATALIATDRVPRGDVDLPVSWDAATADVIPWLARTVRLLTGLP